MRYSSQALLTSFCNLSLTVVYISRRVLCRHSSLRLVFVTVSAPTIAPPFEMESQSSSPLSSYFRHGTVTVAPIFTNSLPSSTSLLIAPTTSPSSESSVQASSIASSTIFAITPSSRPATSTTSRLVLTSNSDPPSSSTDEPSASGSPSSWSFNDVFGNPSASASLNGSDAQPYNPSSLVVVLSIFGILVGCVTIWLIFRYFSRRRRWQQEGDGDRARPNQEGWAKRLTFTGNREKFWQRLDDYHDSLKAREEGRVKRSMAGVSVGQVPRYSTVPPGLDIHPSFQRLPMAQTDNASVRTFMIGSDHELAYLHTMGEDDRLSTPAHSRPPPNVPMSITSTMAGSINVDFTQRMDSPKPSEGAVSLPMDSLSHKRLQSLARATPLPASGSEDSIDRLSIAGTDTKEPMKSILTSHKPHPSQVTTSNVSIHVIHSSSVHRTDHLQDSASFKPAQQHLSAMSNYSVPSSSLLAPDYIPLSHMTNHRHDQAYRSPTESIYGCYKTDDERHASFISTTLAGTGSQGVPAVPPIPPSYRK